MSIFILAIFALTSLYASQVTILVNDKPVDSSSYKLKVGDKIKVTCASSKQGTYSSAIITGNRGGVSDRRKNSPATLESVVTAKDIQDSFDKGIDIRCRASNSNGEYALEDSSSNTVTLKLEGSSGRIKDPNPPKVSAMDIKIVTVPSAPAITPSAPAASSVR